MIKEDFNTLHEILAPSSTVKFIKETYLATVTEEMAKFLENFCELQFKDFIYYNYLRDSDNVVKGITFLTKGESKSLAVAAASLISRYIFIKEFDKLSDTVHIPLPKGAGATVDDIAYEIAKDKGIDYLKEIAKFNFKNTKKVEEMLK